MSTHLTTKITTPDDQSNTTDSLKNQPMELKQNNRLYTTTEQRRQLGIEKDKGKGTKVRIRLRTIDRDTEWNGQYEQNVFYTTNIRYYGAIRVPKSIVDEMGLTEGQNVRTDITVLYRKNGHKHLYTDA